ncbi:MAG: alpha/beta hydrolase [Saprospiraceae bacterium]|nr:alpha/beta hydrolase [Saprospiraceae bacterium]
MYKFILFAFTTFLLFSCAKDEPIVDDMINKICLSDRYVTDQFTDITVTTVKYGNNKTTIGIPIDLFMDVYEPTGDTLSKRPVIIWAFGGAFVGGDRKQLAENARAAARLGYVSACIDYRLLNIFTQWPIDSVKSLDIAVKASTDMKAAIRHFRKDAATINMFKIDPDMIIIGGVSAGAITAIQAAYFDAGDNTDPKIKAVVDANGGIEGTSGDAENLKYSSKVQGVINLSGGIYRTDFIDAGEPPIISFHGDADEVVPYKYDFVRLSGVDIIPLYGSYEIDKRAKQIGLKTSLTTVPDGGHDNIYTDNKFSTQLEMFLKASYTFNKSIVCGN